MNRIGMQGFSLTHNHPEQHWNQPRANIFTLNLDSLVAEVTVAAYNFFDQLQKNSNGVSQNQSMIERAQKLIYVQSYMPIVDFLNGRINLERVVHTQDRFAKMDIALAPLDNAEQIQVRAVQNKIQEIFA
jgi:hypothetical protein